MDDGFGIAYMINENRYALFLLDDAGLKRNCLSKMWSTGFQVDANIERSIQFNIVSKGLGSERMSFWLSEAANEIRDLLLPTVEGPKAKL